MEPNPEHFYPWSPKSYFAVYTHCRSYPYSIFLLLYTYLSGSGKDIVICFTHIYSQQKISMYIMISFSIQQGYRALLYPHILTTEDIPAYFDIFQDPARISGSALPTSTHSRRQSSPTYSPQQSRSYSFYKIQSFRLIKNKKSEISGVRFASACLLSKCGTQYI